MWFDDLKVTHTQNIVVQATDYGVWGDVLREQKTDESIYRFGYQGQFAEKDEETGWNHFELREYDPVVGRWISRDPFRQFWSPYVGMGNEPVNGVDPDGGRCCQDMVGEYAEAMQQMDFNLYDHIRASGGILMDEAVVTPTAFDRGLDVLWAWSQLYEPEGYVNIMFKQAASNGKGKITVPIVGGNFSLSKDGVSKQLITPSSSYLSYKATDYLEYRVYPSEGDKVPGEDASFRVLVLLHNKPYKVGNFEGKIQGDFGAKRDGSAYLGARIVGEYHIIRGQTSVEVNAGFRVNKSIFWLRTPVFNGSLYPRF